MPDPAAPPVVAALSSARPVRRSDLRVGRHRARPANWGSGWGDRTRAGELNEVDLSPPATPGYELYPQLPHLDLVGSSPPSINQ